MISGACRLTILRTHSKNRKSKIREVPVRAAAAGLPDGTGTSLRDKLLGAGILAVALGLFLWFSAMLCRPIFLLASNPERLERFIQEQGALGRVAFLGIQILQGFLPIPLELTAVAGGYAFGRVQGALLTLGSVVISTTAIFYFTKIFGHKVMDLFFTPAQQKNVKYFRDEKVRTAATWIVFLIPGMPKRMFVFSAGLVPQKFSRFLIVSTLARAPALLACSFGGQALGSGNYGQATAIFIVTGIVSVIGIAAFKTVTGKKSKLHRD